ncbi:NUDIX domain-containing protein [Metallosphaera tengchongensis]|uniref:NUDIX domain-containing protein n=1 Tax=Metallosphaera tengchongensis TaxID=1532350 RepID=A0A6N0NYB5_9CREN|nr:NUDIX domain-containing protein [Metallosphaera tengchongensis]QKR00569.1 NUDIX domain-containing protein [Metallosphaera tengchongensis]
MECDAAVILIKSNDGKLLIIKRAEQKGDPWSGHMALPGGHRDGQESCEETALREVKEEVGLTPKNIQFLGIYWPNNRKDLHVAVYLGETDSTDVTPDNEVAKYFWIDPKDLVDQGGRYVYSGYVIWGMTYRIIKDYLSARQRSSHQFQAVDQSSLEE